MTAPHIVLTAINARYSHTSLGARFLLANMGELRRLTRFVERSIQEPPEAIAKRIAETRPGLIGIGVYIWNRRAVEALLPILRQTLPDAKIVLGGPEISFDTDSPLARAADVVIRGEAETLWRELCGAWLVGAPLPACPDVARPPLDALALPDAEYTDDTRAHRNVYVETSRGCPCACEFCLSSVAPGVRRFPESAALASLQRMLDRGFLQFRFVDRSLNLDARAPALLDFFLDRLKPGLRLHFEMTPDGLGPALRSRLLRFPSGALHIEVGIQSFDPDALARVGRRMDVDRAVEGLSWLARSTGASVHADLMAGLPGETLDGFQHGFDRLYRLRPAEIQVGVLKRLHGVALDRHVAACGMRFRESPPYDVLETAHMDAADIANVTRFAMHWERVVNRRRLPRATERLLADGSPWQRFDAFSRRLEARYGRTGFGIVEMAAVMLDFLIGECAVEASEARELLADDYRDGGRRINIPAFLRPVSMSSSVARRE